jgi:anti-sigma factor RsiW
MEHKEAGKKIPAFMDGEIKGDEKDSVSAHIQQCAECKKEYETFSNNDLYLKKGIELEPSDYFISKLNNKINELPVKKPVFTLDRLMPVPIAMGILALLISGMLAAAPVLYAANNSNIKAQVKEMAGKAFAACMTGSIFAPAAFAKFCDTCNMNMCTCCSAKTGQKCTMGGNENGKQK